MQKRERERRSHLKRRSFRRGMSILNAQVNPALAKNIMYLCMAAPAVAFGLRMAKSATECVMRRSRSWGFFARALRPRARLLERLSPSPFPGAPARSSRAATPPLVPPQAPSRATRAPGGQVSNRRIEQVYARSSIYFRK